MKDLMSETWALRATSTLKSLTIGWAGTFSEAGFHQFLTSGFISTEESLTHPGGFTVFMFHPRSYNLGMKLNWDKSHIHEHLGVKQSEDVVDYFARKEFFVPKTSADLKIQLETCLNTLKLLTNEFSIATEGLNFIVRRFDQHLPYIKEMF